jgi:hypothetical protein
MKVPHYKLASVPSRYTSHYLIKLTVDILKFDYIVVKTVQHFFVIFPNSVSLTFARKKFYFTHTSVLLKEQRRTDHITSGVWQREGGGH